MSDAQMAIKINDLRVDHGKGRGLLGIDLALPPGSVTALLGRNGSGKSTLIDACLGLFPRASGKMSVLGFDPRRNGPEVRQALGYVEADPHFENQLTTRQLMRWRARLHPTWSDERAQTLLDQFEIPKDARCGELSRGQRTCLALACALAHQPKLLLLDEPFDGLDVGRRHEILAGIIRFVEGDRAVLIATHDLDEVERIADRVVMIAKGRTILQDPIEKIYADDKRLEESFLELTKTPREVSPC
ncbi:MAG: ABC transporter ATP-binding protein [Planctomycetota bacterium]